MFLFLGGLSWVGDLPNGTSHPCRSFCILDSRCSDSKLTSLALQQLEIVPMPGDRVVQACSTLKGGTVNGCAFCLKNTRHKETQKPD